MTEQQITEFDRWFEQRMDPELNLTPGDKELCRHAWKAALSHAEWEAQPDYVLDALDNLIHDNYERSYRGAKNRQDDAELIRCALRRSHPAPQVAVPEKVRELIGAVRSVNRSRQHSIHIEGDDEPCFWQRAEWVRYVLELADEAEQTITAAPTAPAGEQDPLPVGLSLGPLTDLIHEMDKLCQATPVDFADAVDGGYVDAGVDLHDKIIAECRRLAGMKRQQPVSDPDGLGAERARRLETATVAKLLFKAWSESEPDHAITQHPASYAETFTDMAKAVMPLLSAPASDEREIAAKAIEQTTREYFSDESGPHNLHDYLLWRAKRLRAGKEGE